MNEIDMKICGIAAAFPERVVSNDEILSMIEAHSREVFDGDLPKALGATKMFLEYTGARNRRWIAPGQTVFSYTERAIVEALEAAGIGRQDVDLLIHCGVDRRVVEPGQSFFIAKAMGMKRVQCFDVLEACASWMRAMHLARSLLRGGGYRHILIVTSEFAVHEGEWGYSNFRLGQMTDLEWTFPTYTIGESATATVISAAEQHGGWYFDFVGRPQYAELCMCPIDDYADEVATMNSASLHGKGGRRFVSYGKQMRDIGVDEMYSLLSRAKGRIEHCDIVFPHTQQRRSWNEDSQRIGLELPFYFVYPEYGNLVSGSIPGAMALAECEGRLTRGAQVGVLMAAAGLSLSLAIFQY